MSGRIYGAVIAGGQSTRYGSPKALATVGGRRIVDRVLDALRVVADDVIVLANDASLGAQIGLPFRPDERTGLGALGGIHAALLWAEADGRTGVLAVACDMPFLSTGLLRHILGEATDADVVVPEGGGRHGIEPLCAYYATSCLPSIEAALARQDARMVAFHDDVRVRRVPRAAVERFGAPEILFLNVNTADDRARAERITRGAA
jgi:molybdopterin-guanine dinucleotide biosynthesis protein A